MKEDPALYADHVRTLRRIAEEALLASDFDALIIHSGAERTYFEDDQEIPFRSNPSFAHWLPLPGPGHLLYIEPGRKPVLIRIEPEDFWHESEPFGDQFWIPEFEVRLAKDADSAWKEIPKGKHAAFVGEHTQEAIAQGIAGEALNPPSILSHLHWQRSFKTPYEVMCIEEANRSAAHGHVHAREAFLAGASELEIHRTYVEALDVLDAELPYATITALNEKSAILHYQNKRTETDGTVLLLDAGDSYLGYASDITRTWIAEERCDFLFRGLLGGVEQLQEQLCEMARPGVSFPTLHRTAHVKIGDLLHALDILALNGEDAAEKGLTKAFFPHGLGHLLGTQVHDVGGNQSGKSGATVAPPDDYPKLRMTRTIEEGNVFTIEPGIYFIPMLLKPYREGDSGGYFNWELIDRLMPLGGIRIEDDILATKDGNRNLTRQFLP